MLNFCRNSPSDRHSLLTPTLAGYSVEEFCQTSIFVNKELSSHMLNSPKPPNSPKFSAEYSGSFPYLKNI